MDRSWQVRRAWRPAASSPTRCDRERTIALPISAGIPCGCPTAAIVMFVSGGRDFYVVDTRSRKVEKVFSVPRDIIGPPQLTRDGREAYFTGV